MKRTSVRRWGWAVLSAAMVFLGTASGAAGERDPLWAKALALTGKNLERRPGKMDEEVSIYTLKGELKRHTVSTFTFVKGEDGEPRPSLVKATREGKDVTEERQQELKRRKTRGKLFKDEHNIFHPSWYQTNEVRRTTHKETIGGHPCVAFEYSVKTQDGSWDGVVYLEEKSGIPRRIVSAPDKVPGQEDVDAWDVSLEFNYAYSSPDDWHLKSLVISAKFKTKVAYLIPFTGRFRSVMTFGQYSD